MRMKQTGFSHRISNLGSYLSNTSATNSNASSTSSVHLAKNKLGNKYRDSFQQALDRLLKLQGLKMTTLSNGIINSNWIGILMAKSIRIVNVLLQQLGQFFLVCALLVATLYTATVQAGPREQAKRIYDRIAGVPPITVPSNRDRLNINLGGQSYLDYLADLITNNNDNGVLVCEDAGVVGAQCVALIAMQEPSFYNVTIKNWATPWTNEEQTVFAPLNDYSALIVGTIRDDNDFREILYTNRLYVPDSSFGTYNNNNNAAYEALERDDGDMGDSTVLVESDQTTVTGLPAYATAGVMTTRAAAKAFYVDGTNRAQFRFTLLNHLCVDLEQVKDITRSPARIRQDVSRSPGGDSKIYLNSCLGCHAGMDPLAQAFAYYDYEYPMTEGGDPIYDDGNIVYNDVGTVDETTGTRVQSKYWNNNTTFKYGFITTDDTWDNFWREGTNHSLGWSDSLSGSFDPNDSTYGSAAQMGMELAHSQAFAGCQVKKAFSMVCLREPTEADYTDSINPILEGIATGGGAIQMKSVMAEIAEDCMGD